jgi:6-phosphogluconolactonase (cycloisomerase 2 family)
MAAVTMRLAFAVVLAAAALALLPAQGDAWETSCCLRWSAPVQLAISPDGRFAYAADYQAVFAFARDPSSGALSVIDSYDVRDGGGTTELSPDGRTLYVVSRVIYASDPKIVQFRRDENTGTLSLIGGYGAWRDVAAEFGDIVFTHDGRSAYMSGPTWIEAAGRDPATGQLDLRSQLHAGDAAAPDLTRPTGLELSPDDRFLYVVQHNPETALLVFSRADDGSLTQQQAIPLPGIATDIALSPDGARLYTGPSGPRTYARDPSTGALTFIGSADIGLTTYKTAGAEAQLLPTPDGAGLYSISPDDHHLYQFAVTAGGLDFVKTYRENADGQGIRDPRGLSISPDGASVYLGSGADAGRIASFRRQPDTNLLSFSALFEGPVLEGHPPRDPKVTINAGAEYTNDPDVVLTIEGVGPPGAFYVYVSNDGGFARDATEAVPVNEPTVRLKWTLSSSGPERLPKTVYMRAFAHGGEQVVTDEIELDQRPPALVSARQLPGVLRVEARDGQSGVARMQVTRDRRKPGKWKAFQRRTKLHTGRRTLYVRVRDRAGNRSKWVAARGRR